jgi:hypothetical protein
MSATLLLVLGLALPGCSPRGLSDLSQFQGPADTTLVELFAVTTNSRVTVEAVEQDGTLLLPSSALRELLGIPPPPTPWMSLEQLQHEYPTVVVRWDPTEGRVLIFDELSILPAVRAFRETHRASAYGVVGLPQYSGPYGSWAVDDQKRSVAELGYLWKGRVAALGRVDDRGTAQWSVSAAPLSRLYVGANGGTGQPTTATGRVQAGPVWVLSTFTPHHPLDMAGLVRAGPMQVFASRQFAVLTITPPGQWAVQLATRWSDHRTAGRISFGPTVASPFSFPQSFLSH